MNILPVFYIQNTMNQEFYKNLIGEIPSRVTLIAVSKTKPESDILTLYELGQRHFGENWAQELRQKHEDLPKDICWHFIGHLQTNKIKYIIPYVHLIHSIDSFHLLEEVNRQAEKCGRVVPCLLQFHIATEETKFGFSLEECFQMIENQEFKKLQNIELRGVMGMSSVTDDQSQIRREFAQLRTYYDELKQNFFSHQDSFKEISMGMSGDYPIAIEEGSTMIRVGSAIFGARDYGKG